METYELKQLVKDEISDEALVNCPKKNCVLRKCVHCVGCEFNMGFVEPNPNVAVPAGGFTEHPFNIRYRLVCNHPVTRTITPFLED